MADFNDSREMGWEDEIVQEEEEKVLLPEGDYKFTVAKVERARFSGSANVKECNQAKVAIIVHGEKGNVELNDSFFLLTNFEWKLSQFFLSLGMKKHGEPLRMNWTAAVGKTGTCKIFIAEFTSKSGEKKQVNRISRYYAYDEEVNPVIPAIPVAPSVPATPYAQVPYSQPYTAYPSYTPQTQTGYSQPQTPISPFGGAPAWGGKK